MNAPSPEAQPMGQPQPPAPQPPVTQPPAPQGKKGLFGLDTPFGLGGSRRSRKSKKNRKSRKSKKSRRSRR